MKTVYKYPLQVEDTQVVLMPPGARILSVDAQKVAAAGFEVRIDMCLWAMVDKDVPPTEKRHIVIAGTGHSLTALEGRAYTFIGTVLMQYGALVWHVFEMGAQER